MSTIIRVANVIEYMYEYMYMYDLHLIWLIWIQLTTEKIYLDYITYIRVVEDDFALTATNKCKQTS